MVKTKEKIADVVMSADEKLADHLKQAEEHLIAAVKLFELKPRPERTHAYLERLTRAQEMVTTLFREELVRIRGPIKMTATISKRKK